MGLGDTLTSPSRQGYPKEQIAGGPSEVGPSASAATDEADWAVGDDEDEEAELQEATWENQARAVLPTGHSSQIDAG